MTTRRRSLARRLSSLAHMEITGTNAEEIEANNAREYGSKKTAKAQNKEWATAVESIQLSMFAPEPNKGNLKDILTSKSLGIFSFNNSVRVLCRRIVDSQAFDTWVMGMILATCVGLALENPMAGNDSTIHNDRLAKSEAWFVVFFLVEMVLRIIANGLWWCGPPSYLNSGWNWMDGTIAIIGVVTISLGDASSSSADVKALRAFRVVRPLRIISSLPTLQVVLGSLGSSIPRLTHVASLLGFILLIAAIIGLEFYRDLDTSLSPNPNPKVVNFQNAGNSFLTVFTVVTLEGWSGI
eukprot:gene24299-12096_t